MKGENVKVGKYCTGHQSRFAQTELVRWYWYCLPGTQGGIGYFFTAPQVFCLDLVKIAFGLKVDV